MSSTTKGKPNAKKGHGSKKHGSTPATGEVEAQVQPETGAAATSVVNQPAATAPIAAPTTTVESSTPPPGGAVEEGPPSSEAHVEEGPPPLPTAAPPGPNDSLATAPPAGSQSATAPKKAALSTEEIGDRFIHNLVRDELKDRQELIRIDAEQDKLRGVIQSLGGEIPPDEGVTAPIAVAESNGQVKGKGKAGKTFDIGPLTGLRGVVVRFMVEKGFILPTYGEAKVIVAHAEKKKFNTAPNLLSNMASKGHLIKGGRGQYALPQGYVLPPE